MPQPNRLLLMMTRHSMFDTLRGLFGSSLIWFPKLSDLTGTTAVDYSAAGGRDGTYSGNVTLANATGPAGQPCPTFGGVNGKVVPTVAALAALNTAGVFNPLEGTLGIWFRFNSAALLNDANIYAMIEIGVDANNRYLIYKSAANTISVFYHIGASSATLNLATAFTSLAMHHALLTWSQSLNLIRRYLDGVQVGADVNYSGIWAGALNATWTQIGAVNNSSYYPGNQSYPFLTNVFSTPAQAQAAGRVGA